MKYENFEEAEKLVKAIQIQEQLLADLNSPEVTVKVCCHGSYTIRTIGTWESCEHNFKNQAQTFVDELKASTAAEIRLLKEKLSEL